MQKSIFPQRIQKSLCITTKSLYTNSKFQMQLSRKLQRFRTCCKNKKCSIFHELSEYQQKRQHFPHWTDPLMQKSIFPPKIQKSLCITTKTSHKSEFVVPPCITAFGYH